VDHLFVAESYLELGDSAAALERLRDYARKFPRSIHAPFQLNFVPRFWIRYGDLAYALHQREEAIHAYRFITELWADADPIFQPAVQRARTRLAELTGGAN
jgi:tetratricopeptide (TPR) repeat protein